MHLAIKVLANDTITCLLPEDRASRLVKHRLWNLQLTSQNGTVHTMVLKTQAPIEVGSMPILLYNAAYTQSSLIKRVELAINSSLTLEVKGSVPVTLLSQSASHLKLKIDLRQLTEPFVTLNLTLSGRLLEQMTLPVRQGSVIT